MNEVVAKELLAHALSFWRAKPYSELAANMSRSQSTRAIGTDNKHYRIEIQIVWDSKPSGDIKVLGSIDDSGVRTLKPFCDDFILTPNGEFVGNVPVPSLLP